MCFTLLVMVSSTGKIPCKQDSSWQLHPLLPPHLKTIKKPTQLPIHPKMLLRQKAIQKLTRLRNKNLLISP